MERRPTLAHAFALLAGVAGCADMHGRTSDAGGACRCDVGFGADAPPDAIVLLPDAPRVVSCDAEDAAAMTCALTCDGPPIWHWNGFRCEPIDCGACVGTDCAGAPRTESECVGAHAACEASICRSTGGTWMWWAEECGHRECGRPTLAICESGMPVCDCGPDSVFVPGVGCETSATCVEGPPTTPELRCTSSGGTWGSFCCDSRCGVPCGDDCVAPACNCGPMEIFDDRRGCIDALECWEPAIDQTCNAGSRCPSGALCCEHCGGDGCFGPPTCEVPVCDTDPNIDECGNNLLAP